MAIGHGIYRPTEGIGKIVLRKKKRATDFIVLVEGCVYGNGIVTLTLTIHGYRLPSDIDAVNLSWILHGLK